MALSYSRFLIYFLLSLYNEILMAEVAQTAREKKKKKKKKEFTCCVWANDDTEVSVSSYITSCSRIHRQTHLNSIIF